MKENLRLLFALSMMVILSCVLSSCGDDDPAPVAPDITISAETFTGDIGDEVSVTVNGTLDGEFAVLRISKFIGTDPDASYGTNGVMEVTTGLPYTFDYTLGVDGLTEPIRFNFEVEDSNGLKGDANLIITTNATRESLLVSFNWRWASQEFEGDQTLRDCEADNVWSFEADGSVSLDYGALTGSGGGSCDFDGTLDHTSWEMNAAMDTLEIFRADAVTGAPQDSRIYAIKTFDQTGWTADEPTIFGVFSWRFAAEAKN